MSLAETTLTTLTPAGSGSSTLAATRVTSAPWAIADLSRRRGGRGRDGQVIVGFAAETNPDLDAAKAKLARKGSDFLVMNQVGGGRGFGAADNEWIVLAADGVVTPVPRQSKDALADFVLALVTARLR